MKILFITPYPFNQAPSQRFRFEQYYSFINSKTITIDKAPFLDLKTWNLLYSSGNKQKKAKGIIKGVINRFLLIFSLHKYNFIFIHREACPIGPAFFEFLYTKVFRKKMIFDFDDAIWLFDVSEANGKLGWLKNPNKTSKIIKYATLVTAGNQYLSDYAKSFNEHVFKIPTTINTDYHFCNKNYCKEIITIGWTGTSTTIKHFELSYPVLKVLKAKYGAKINFMLISNKPSESSELLIDYIPWKKESEIDDLAKIDIGIMPLPNDKWAKGKCGFKGLQYMSLGIPTIMSPVGVNSEIIEDGINGFLAESESEWIEKISFLIESEKLRRELGCKGRETIVRKYSVESQKNNYLAIFQKIASQNK